MSRVGVVLVNHHSEDLVDRVVGRLAGADIETVVVDNSGTLERWVSIVDPGGNIGFGAGCNRGVAALAPDVDVVCLHNPDVEAAPATILALADRLRAQHGRPGALAPAVRDASTLRPAGYHYPSPRRELLLALGVRRPAIARPTRVPVAGQRFGTAALLVVHRDAWRRVGGFDERFFLYGEDLDLWHRLDSSGAETGFAPDLVVAHAQAAGSSLDRRPRELLRWIGIELFAATSGLVDWRTLRRIHRLALPRLRRGAPLLADAVELLWRRGEDPVEVAAALRPGLADGTLLGASEHAVVRA